MRDLRKLSDVWHHLGRQDPFWAALTDADKQHGRWSAAEFYQSGLDEITALLDAAETRGHAIRRIRALDFGCGPGRLTQALARTFDRVDGVDISRSMLAVAEAHNQHGSRCRYVHHTAPDLAIYGNATFDFIYSSLTLQHIPPELSRAYITELVRVLAPEGLLIFQLPSHRAPVEPSGPNVRTIPTGRLADRAMHATVTLDTDVAFWTAGETRLLRVSVINDGPDRWPAGSRDDGLYRIQIGNRWRASNGDLAAANDGRTPLPHDVAPGEEVTVFLEATAPPFDGGYVIEIDLVQEHVAWFQERGSQSLRAACHVRGGRPPTVPSIESRRLGQRFPRLRAALVGAGLDAIRGGWRRARERRRTRRWQRAAMVMHCVPQAEVVHRIEQSGGRVADVDQELIPGGYLSCRYWVVKPA